MQIWSSKRRVRSNSWFWNVAYLLIEQTTSSIELVVLKRRIFVVIRKDSRCLLQHRLAQHRRILLSKETYRTFAQTADPCGNPFRNMIWKISNPTLSTIWWACGRCTLLVQIKPNNGFETEKVKNMHRQPGYLPPPPKSLSAWREIT